MYVYQNLLEIDPVPNHHLDNLLNGHYQYKNPLKVQRWHSKNLFGQDLLG